MDESKQRDIAAKGGASVPDEKRSFSQDHDLASEAGRMGGESRGDGRQQQAASDSGRGQQGNGHRGGGGNFANDRERAAEAGRKGGQH